MMLVETEKGTYIIFGRKADLSQLAIKARVGDGEAAIEVSVDWLDVTIGAMKKVREVMNEGQSGLMAAPGEIGRKVV